LLGVNNNPRDIKIMKCTCNEVFSVASLLFLLSLNMVIVEGEETMNIGHAWIKYRHDYFYEDYFHEYWDPYKIAPLIFDNEYVTTIDVYEHNGTHVSFLETRRYLNKSIRYHQIVIADLSVPHYNHPEISVHTFFIPKSLNAGDPVPGPIYIRESDLLIPWAQTINETVGKLFAGIHRQCNHIYWTRETDGASSTGKGKTYKLFQEKNVYYDRETGIMLSLYYNFTDVVYNEEGTLVRKYVNITEYKIIETSLWNNPFKTVQRYSPYIITLLLLLALLLFKRDIIIERVKSMKS